MTMSCPFQKEAIFYFKKHHTKLPCIFFFPTGMKSSHVSQPKEIYKHAEGNGVRKFTSLQESQKISQSHILELNIYIVFLTKFPLGRRGGITVNMKWSVSIAQESWQGIPHVVQMTARNLRKQHTNSCSNDRPIKDSTKAKLDNSQQHP